MSSQVADIAGIEDCSQRSCGCPADLFCICHLMTDRERFEKPKAFNTPSLCERVRGIQCQHPVPAVSEQQEQESQVEDFPGNQLAWAELAAAMDDVPSVPTPPPTPAWRRTPVCPPPPPQLRRQLGTSASDPTASTGSPGPFTALSKNLENLSTFVREMDRNITVSIDEMNYNVMASLEELRKLVLVQFQRR